MIGWMWLHLAVSSPLAAGYYSFVLSPKTPVIVELDNQYGGFAAFSNSSYLMTNVTLETDRSNQTVELTDPEIGFDAPQTTFEISEDSVELGIWVIPKSICNFSNPAVLRFSKQANADMEFHGNTQHQCIFLANFHASLESSVYVNPTDQSFVGSIYTNSSLGNNTAWKSTKTDADAMKSLWINETFFITVDNSIAGASFHFESKISNKSEQLKHQCFFNNVPVYDSSSLVNVTDASVEYIVNCEEGDIADRSMVVAFTVAGAVFFVLIVFVTVKCWKHYNAVKMGEVIEVKHDDCENLLSVDTVQYTEREEPKTVVFFERSKKKL